MLSLFGSLFLYLLYGAIAGDLYIPGKRGPGVNLSGFPAWLTVAAPVLSYGGILVRHHDLFPQLSPSCRTVCELSLLAAGIACFMFAIRLHREALCAL